jgi:hypothetical protein
MNGTAHTLSRAWRKLEKQRGVRGMTWGFKFQRVAFALAVMGALALASGANWVNVCYLLNW